MRRPTFKRALLGCAALACVPTAAALAATPAATPLVTAPITDAATVSIPGSMATSLAGASDAGALASSHTLEHLQLILKRSPARQAALDALVAAQTDPKSSSFHQWLTPAQLASSYGPAPADIAKTESWLTSRGLKVNSVSPTGMSIDFTGDAATVGSAFHTALHAYTRNGAAHFSAATAPAIPAALAPVVSGASLSNFFPKPMLTRAASLPAAKLAGAKVQKIGSSYTMNAGGTTYYAVTPSDFATIYNENQAFKGTPVIGEKITGKGVTLVVAEQTDINPADWNSFRTSFGLTGYPGTLSITHPGRCTDPGFTGDEGEAAIDAEWSGAVAPGANIVEAACAGTETTFGVETTLQNLVELGTPAVAISVSYGGCEQGQSLTFEQGWTNLVEEGAAEGIAIFVSSGDSAAAGCDENAIATDGLAVNGLATPPYVTAIGGTDFLDTALKENATYWSSSNSTTGGSAKSYVPEIPWDNSCSNAVNYTYVGASGPIANCNVKKPKASYQNAVGGSGGQSELFAKPDYQSTSLSGVPDDGVRDIPDVSFFAANGFWNHFYLECMSDPNEGGAPCDFTNPTDFLDGAYGGTSFGAPDFAGVAALVAQYKGYRSGNFAPRLYQLAQLQFSNSTLARTCNSNTGAAVGKSCIFNDVTTGDNTAPCQSGTPNCAVNSSSTMGIGVLSTTSSKNDAGFPTTGGYDLATGLGTVNVTNLIINY